MAKEVERPKPNQPSDAAIQRYVAQGKLIVMVEKGYRFDPNGKTLGIESIDRILSRLNVEKITPFHTAKALLKGEQKASAERLTRMLKIEFVSLENPIVLAREVARLQEVEFAEPYFYFDYDYTVNDPRADDVYAIEVLRVDEAWDVTKGDASVGIGIVDSGVQWDHPDLENNIFINEGEWGVSGELSANGVDDDGNGYIDDFRGWDFGNNDNDPYDRGIIVQGGRTYHGTMAAGCAAATPDNGIGIAGLGFNCRVLPVKVGTDDGGFQVTYGYEGIKYASDVGCRVVSCSWTAAVGTLEAMQAIIDYCMDNGTLVMSSAGNNPIDHDFNLVVPSGLDGVVPVSSIEANGRFSTWSTYGTTVELYAPGSGVFTTNANKGYTYTQGTSFSCPYAAGVAGLLFAMHPEWTPQQVARQLRVTSAPFNANPDPKRFGKIDAYRAVSTNANFESIPGFVIEDMQFDLPDNEIFTDIVQFDDINSTGTFTVTFRNILGPSTENCIVKFEGDNSILESAQDSYPIGAVGHDETVDVTFELKINPTDTTMFTEAAYNVRFRIEDDEVIDYLPERISLWVDEGYHRTDFNFRPSFTSIDIVDQNVIWAAARDENTGAPVESFFRTTDGGQTWFEGGNQGQSVSGWPSGGSEGVNGIYCITGIDANTAMVGLSAGTRSRVYRTSDGGQNWEGKEYRTITRFINFIHMFDDQNGIFQGDPLAGEWGLAKTTDGGQNWDRLSTPLSAETDELGWNNAYDFVGDIGWMGTNANRIYKTTDRGETWTAYPLPGKNSVDVTFRDELVGAARFAQQGEGTDINGENGIAITEDGGETWTMLTSIEVNGGGAIEFEDRAQRLFLMNDGNAYVSYDLGQTWTIIPYPASFFISDSDNLVYEDNGRQSLVAAAGAYLFEYRSPASAEVVSAEPVADAGDFRIGSVYPNPVNIAASSGVTVSFTVPASQPTQIAIYDALGRFVKTAVSATLRPGSHSAYLDLADVPVGTYFVKVTSGDAAKTARFTIVR